MAKTKSVDGPEKFSRPVRFAFIVILVIITWLLVVACLSAAFSGLVDISTELTRGQEQSTS